MSVSMKTLRQAEFDLEELRYAFLRGRGWNHTSHTPGCLWLWEKDIARDGVTQRVVVSDQTALAIEGVVLP